MMSTMLVSLLSLLLIAQRACAYTTGMPLSGTDCAVCTAEINACDNSSLAGNCIDISAELVTATFSSFAAVCVGTDAANQLTFDPYTSATTEWPSLHAHKNYFCSEFDAKLPDNNCSLAFDALYTCAYNNQCYQFPHNWPSANVRTLDDPCTLHGNSYLSANANLSCDDTSANITACDAELVACQQNWYCLGSIANIPTQTFCEKACIAGYVAYWASQGLTVASEYLTCVNEHNCLGGVEFPDCDGDGGGDDSGCDCNAELATCMGYDAGCKRVLEEVDFDNSPNPFGDIYDICQEDNCTGIDDVMNCFLGPLCKAEACDAESDGYDFFECNISSLAIECTLTDICFLPFNATLFGYQAECEAAELFCYSATAMDANRDIYCAEAGNDCSDAVYQEIYTLFTVMLAGNDCPFVHCESLIDACVLDATCSHELFLVSELEDTYGIEDDDIFVEMKDFMCSQQTAGQCTTALDDTFSCWSTNCGSFDSSDSCIESNCLSEIGTCFDETACGVRLLSLLEAQHECDGSVAQAYESLDDSDPLRKCCPEECSAIEDEFTFDDCCTQEVKEACHNECLKCEDENGKNSTLPCLGGGCGDAFASIMTCASINCPDGDDEEDFCPVCAEHFAPCYFYDNGCYDDFTWVSVHVFGDDGSDNTSNEDDDGIDFDFLYYEMGNCNATFLNETYLIPLSGMEDGPTKYAIWDTFFNIYVNCMYSQLQYYCEDTAALNPDGCSVEFWDMANCMFTQCLAPDLEQEINNTAVQLTINTRYPSSSPTTGAPSTMPTTGAPTSMPVTGVPTLPPSSEEFNVTESMTPAHARPRFAYYGGFREVCLVLSVFAFVVALVQSAV